MNQFPDDICDDDILQELSQVSLQRTVADHSYDGRPMDQHTAMVGDTCLRLALEMLGAVLVMSPDFLLAFYFCTSSGIESCSSGFQSKLLHR